jgi:sulfur carrier protein
MRSERECQTRRMEISETQTIEVVLNGERRSVPAGLTVERLLTFLEMNPSRVAVELDRAIVRKSDWPTAEVRDGAQLEVVWFVGGG